MPVAGRRLVTAASSGLPGTHTRADLPRQISPIISIVFNMLIIRIGLASDRSFLGAASNTAQGTWAAAASASIVDRAVRRRTDGTYAMKDLKVEITQVIEHDSEYTMVDTTSPAVRTRERDPRVLRDILDIDVEVDSGSQSPRSSMHRSPLEKAPVEDGLV